MGDHCDAALGTEVDEPTSHRTVVDHAERNLDGGDVDDVERVLELAGD